MARVTHDPSQSALEALCDYALYKSTFTLHYIRDQKVNGQGH